MNINTAYIKICAITFLLACGTSFSLVAQDAESKPPERPVRNMFESNWLIDHQTVALTACGHPRSAPLRHPLMTTAR